MDKKRYEIEHVVEPDEIDAFRHVNNVVYLKWFIRIAAEHCASAGWSVKKMCEELGQGWIIKSHQLEYLIPVKPYQKVKIVTWVEYVKAASSERRYEALDERGRVCAKGSTIWVWVDYRTGRPLRIPAEIAKSFGF
ncbi:MAG: acyl-CoA thioesterase [Elusimicrobia bacterium CG08_land_8_20_14_0_20_51_18]|nr:MAG: acyl-CoA thioesterase [Elusimicrobia bacterium CG08_land_8_20_14_0_20_51_18]